MREDSGCVCVCVCMLERSLLVWWLVAADLRGDIIFLIPNWVLSFSQDAVSIRLLVSGRRIYARSYINEKVVLL
jgi:hypothetical protein